MRFRTLLRWVRRLVLVLLVALVALYFLRDRLLAGPLARFAAEQLSSALGGRFTLERIEGSYFTNIKLIGLRTLEAPPEGPLTKLDFDEAEAEFSIFSGTSQQSPRLLVMFRNQDDLSVPQRYNQAPHSRPLISGLSLKGQKKDGETFDAEIALTPVESSDGMLVSSTIRDISADDTSEAYFRNVLESAPDAMVIIDHFGKITVVNGQAERMFGYSRKELLGQEVEMLLPEDVRERHISHRAAYSATPWPCGANRISSATAPGPRSGSRISARTTPRCSQRHVVLRHHRLGGGRRSAQRDNGLARSPFAVLQPR